MMMRFSYEQCALTDIPAGGRFVERIFGATERRRFYIVVKHFMGWQIEVDENGLRRRSNDKIPKTKVKYISEYDADGAADWIESIWEDHNEDGFPVMVMKMTEI